MFSHIFSGKRCKVRCKSFRFTPGVFQGFSRVYPTLGLIILILVRCKKSVKVSVLHLRFFRGLSHFWPYSPDLGSGIFELHMRSQCNTDIRMPHKVLKRLWIHSGLRHVGTGSMAAYIHACRPEVTHIPAQILRIRLLYFQ